MTSGSRMMNAWHVKLFLRAAGVKGSSANILTRIQSCPLSPTLNASVTFSRSLALCSRPLPLSQCSNMSVIVASHIGSPLMASGLLLPKTSSVCVSRAKSKKSGRKKNYQRQAEDSDSDDEEEEMELEVGPDFRDIRARVSSLRMDALLKAGLNMSRNKVEAAFYASKIRINGEKVLKKSHQCHVGDEIDVIKGVAQQNSDNLYVARVAVLALGDIDEEDDKVTVKLRRYPNLLVKCYRDYTPSEQEE